MTIFDDLERQGREYNENAQRVMRGITRQVEDDEDELIEDTTDSEDTDEIEDD